MRFTIPYYNMKIVEKMANRIAKKTNLVKFEIIEEVWLRYPNLPSEDPRRVKGYIVEAEGNYRINGWEFVAVLEHKDNGNIIRNISDRELPEEFRTRKPYCDHCGTMRNRKDTFVVYNSTTDEYKQVGSSCLMEYTGIDLEVAAGIASFVKGLEVCQEVEESDEFFMINNYEYCGLYTDTFKQHAYKIVSSKGYNKDNTIGLILEDMEVNKTPEYKEQLELITNWIFSDTSNSEYMNNLKVVWNCETLEYRDLRLVASAISIALKGIQEQSANCNSWVGNVGDRISIEVSAVKVLYTKYNYYGDTVVYKITDTQGHTYIYSTDKDMSYVKKFKATVKAHEEYKGVKQTVVTRAVIEDAYKHKVEEVKGSSNCTNALEEFFIVLEGEPYEN